MARSAARLSATGALNVTTTGCATPTTSPRVGRTEAMAGLYDWFAAAMLALAGAASRNRIDPDRCNNTQNNPTHGFRFLRNYNSVDLILGTP